MKTNNNIEAWQDGTEAEMNLKLKQSIAAKCISINWKIYNNGFLTLSPPLESKISLFIERSILQNLPPELYLIASYEI